MYSKRRRAQRSWLLTTGVTGVGAASFYETTSYLDGGKL